ncbi:MAG TPA: RNA polymerase sigma factor [Clostridia bacterium]|nr:RNA polymerase sigma factor [Clostridia bacterium]
MQEAREYFRDVYEETYQDMLRYAVIKTRNAADVEDILQNAYTKLYRRIERRGYADIDNPAAFMMRVVQKEIVGYYRFRLVKEEKERPLPEYSAADSFSLEDAAASAETLRSVWKVIEAAPALSYKSFVLHYYFGMSVLETAKALGVSEANITSRLHRVRQTIKSRLKKEE